MVGGLACGQTAANAADPPSGVVAPADATGSYDEAEAQAIDGMLMCPVCPAETIDQAQVPLAKQMRQIVRDKLAAGETRQEILDFFAERYGQAVIAAPPKSGFNLLAWGVPVVGVLVALAAGLLALRAMTRSSSQTSVDGLTDSGPDSLPSVDSVGNADPSLHPYLEMADRQISGASGPFAGESGPPRETNRQPPTES